MVRRIHSLKQIPQKAIVLNPATEKTLHKDDITLAEKFGIVALDCSWNRAEEVLHHPVPGENRRLPSLLAGNPTNYSAVGKLSTVEALAASLWIIGRDQQAKEILRSFSWGRTFYTLNRELLEVYARNASEEACRLDSILRRGAAMRGE